VVLFSLLFGIYCRALSIASVPRSCEGSDDVWWSSDHSILELFAESAELGILWVYRHVARGNIALWSCITCFASFWHFSLLTVCIVVDLSQIQNVSSRSERVFIESRQLKICATCFDLALALLRVLEMVASIAPEIFTDVTRSSSELLLARLCQVCTSWEQKDCIRVIVTN